MTEKRKLAAILAADVVGFSRLTGADEDRSTRLIPWCRLGGMSRATARAEAELLDREAKAGRFRGLLHGIPVGIKDIIDVAGMTTMANSKLRANSAPATADAEIVAAAPCRHRRSGCRQRRCWLLPTGRTKPGRGTPCRTNGPSGSGR